MPGRRWSEGFRRMAVEAGSRRGARGARAFVDGHTGICRRLAGALFRAKLTEAGEGKFEVLEQADQYAEARTSPAELVDAGAFSAAYAVYKNLAVTPGTWTEKTTVPYDSDAHNYRDPVWSNSGGGAQHVGGRMTALAVDGSTLYAGAADGGVWKKVGNGAWQPLTDDSPTLSIGALSVDPGHGLWVGTGEANTSSDSYAGIGVLYSADGGATFSRVGGDELNNHTVGRLVYDNGFVLAATSRGLYRHSATTLTGAWTPVLAAGVGLPSICSQSGGIDGKAFVSDVAVKPGTGGNVVDAVVGWRAGSNCNGFFESTNGGQTFSRSPSTARSTTRTSAGRRSPGRRTAPRSTRSSSPRRCSTRSRPTRAARTCRASTSRTAASPGRGTRSPSGGTSRTAGSALGQPSKGYHPGVQAWYNQFLAVDPANANHVFLGLEEVFETTNGGGTWRAAGPYWNFGLPCSSNGLDNCPPTTHPDQHAVAIGNGRVYVGDDGGVYSRGLNSTAASPPERRPEHAAVLLRRRGPGLGRRRAVGRPAGQRRVAAPARGLDDGLAVRRRRRRHARRPHERQPRRRRIRGPRHGADDERRYLE